MSSSTTQLIDNISKHATPEGLMLTMTPAGLLPRISAWLFDMMIRIAIMIACSIILSLLGNAGTGFMLISYFLLNWLYPVYFEVWRGGMTPGKKRQGLYVCHDDGTPVTLSSSMTRNMLRVADFLPMFFMAGVISILFNKKSQRLGDMVAGTVVVYRQNDELDKLYPSIYGYMQGKQLLDADQTPNVTADYNKNSPLFTFPLKHSEQKALLNWSDRLVFLSEARQHEISGHLSALVEQSSQTDLTGDSAKNAIRQAVVDRARLLKGEPIVKVAHIDPTSSVPSELPKTGGYS